MSNKFRRNIFFLFFLILGLSLTVNAFAAGTLSLEEAVKSGIENNIDLQGIEHDKNKAQINYDSARKAFYPEINISTSYTRMFLPDSSSGNSGGGSFPTPERQFDGEILKILADMTSNLKPNENNYQTSISIQQPIYLGGKIWLGLKQADKGLEVAKVQVEQKENEVLFNIIQSYYNVLMAQERVDIEKEALDLVREHKRTAEVSYNAGLTLKTDILQVEIEEGKAVHSLEVARNDLLMAKKMLGNTIGMDISDLSLKWPGLKPEINLEKDKQYQLASENRPELKLLNLNKDVMETNLQMEKNSHLPNIVLSGNYQWQDKELNFDDGTGTITLAASVNLFDRGLSKNKQDKIKEDISKVDLNKDNLQKLMEIEIEDLILTIKENKNNIDLQELNLKKAEENLELETKRYKVGMGTNINVMNAQMVLKQTRIAQMQAEYQYKISLFKLLLKTGKLLDYCQGVLINE